MLVLECREAALSPGALIHGEIVGFEMALPRDRVCL